jgi:hypothetical protein
MFKSILNYFGYDKTTSELAKILAQPSLREDFLGVAQTKFPSPDKIISDAAKITRYASSDEFKVFANEVWARSLGHLDSILDANTTGEKLQYHRGALRASLDLLRLSYQARSEKERLEAETKQQQTSQAD